MTHRCSRRLIVAFTLGLPLLAVPWRPARAQWSELTAGSEASQYLYALQLHGWWGGESSAIRPYGPRPLQRWQRDSVPAHPWRARFAPAGRRVRWLRPQLLGSLSSGDFPWVANDGALWQGLGGTVAASAGVALRLGPLTMRLEPMLFRTQNRPFPLLGDTADWRTPFLDPLRPGSVDLPQRFGRGAYQRVDWGTSELRVDVGPVAVGLSTMPRSWGPGLRHSLLFTGNAPGVPHIFLGTPEAWRTPIGRLAGELFYGRGSPSGYEPAVAVRDRMISGFVGSWQPRSGKGLEIGGARLYHKFWPEEGISPRMLSAPFGSFFTDLQYYYGGDADNQLLSAFARWRSATDGFELYGEFGRNDRSLDIRDVVTEPEQNSAWLVGFAKASSPHANRFWLVRGDLANGRIGSISRVLRGQAFFYEHTPVTQGHTQRGQLLGTTLMERSGGLELAIDKFAPTGRMGAMLTSRAMPVSYGEGSLSGRTRTQWALEGSAVRFRGASEITVRGGLILDVNRWPGRDGHARYISVATRLGF